MKKMMILSLTSLAILGLAACQNNTENDTKTSTNSKETIETTATTEETSKNSQKQETTQSSQTQNNVKISLEEAIKIYQKEVPNTDITSIDLEKSLGNYHYNISGIDDTNEYELIVDGQTKKISKNEKEKLDSDEANGAERQKEKLDLTNLLSIEEASDIATKQVGNGEAIEWNLEKERDTTYWEVEVKNNNQTTDVKIDAYSGKILETN